MIYENAVPLSRAITSLERIANRLRNELLLFGVAVALEIALILGIGAVYKAEQRLLPLLAALLVCSITNLSIIHKASILMQAAKVRREAEQEAEEQRHRLQREFDTEVRMAFDSLAISAQGIINPFEGGDLVRGWKNNLDVRGITGVWQRLPDILAISLKVEYRTEGPTHDE